MESTVLNRTLRQVRELLKRNDVAGAIERIEALRPADQADVFEELPAGQQEALIPKLDLEDAADILEELDDEDAAELAAHIPPQVLAQIVDTMEPDEAADLLGDLKPSLSAETLSRMQEADEVEPLLLHPDETAGGQMTSEYLAFPQGMRVADVLGALREWMPKGAENHYLYVIEPSNRLVGVVGLLQLIRADPQARLAEIMDREVARLGLDDRPHK